MATLEDSTQGAVIRGMLTDGLVTVDDVKWVGKVAVEVNSKDAADPLANEQTSAERLHELADNRGGHGVSPVETSKSVWGSAA